MPRLVHSNPKYRKHRVSGQAVVTLDGRDFYLGPHGTAASRQEYDRLIGEWLQNGRRMPRARASGAPADLTVVELVAAYWRHAREYYTGHGGELGSIKLALGHLKALYGRTPVSEFGPLALRAVRQRMVDAGWSRRYVNRQTDKVRRAFRWGVSQELVPATVYQALQAVEGLRRGKTTAPEGEPVRPVPEEHVAAVKDHVSRQVWAMIELQSITGMRPGEVVIMRTRDLDTTGRLWLYRPASHKTQNAGHERIVYFGPRAQAVVAPWLRTNLDEHLFQPREAEAERREKAHAERKENGMPLSCGNVPGSNRKRRPGRVPGDRYTVAATAAPLPPDAKPISACRPSCATR